MCGLSEKLPNFLFLDLLSSSITASWISATTAKCSPFKFIFNWGNGKYSGGYKSGE